MTTHITKTWFDGEKVVKQEIPEAEFYKPSMTKDEALELAFDLALMHHTDDKYPELRQKVRHAIRQALAAPVQEPVGWLENLQRLASICPELNMVNYSEEDVDDLNCWAIEVATCIDSITTPPAAQRQWVGLTDEEIEKACVPLGAAMLSFTEVARAIEAKLKEKNT
jgi:hypothetical protein